MYTCSAVTPYRSSPDVTVRAAVTRLYDKRPAARAARSIERRRKAVDRANACSVAQWLAPAPGPQCDAA
jgi:hypothetical protein